jgi:hypothetical protein
MWLALIAAEHERTVAAVLETVEARELGAPPSRSAIDQAPQPVRRPH